MRILIVFLLLFIGQNAFCQNLGSISFELKKCQVSGDTVDGLDHENIEMSLDFKRLLRDTLKLKVIHHQGDAIVSSFKSSFVDVSEYMLKFARYDVKPGDQISFVFTMNGSSLRKTFLINSTTSSLRKPYFVDVYFVYNTDTIPTDRFRIDSKKLRREDGEKSVRLFYDDPKELPAQIKVVFNNLVFSYPFERSFFSSLYRGAAYLWYSDKEDSDDWFNINKKIELIDIESGRGFGKGEHFTP